MRVAFNRIVGAAPSQVLAGTAIAAGKDLQIVYMNILT